MSFLLNNPAWNSTSPAFLQTHLFSIREHFLYYLFIILTSRPSSPSGTHDTQVDKTLTPVFPSRRPRFCVWS